MDSFPITNIPTEMGHMINSIEPADAVMTFAAILWFTFMQVLLIEPSVDSPYRSMTPNIQCRSNTIFLEHQTISLSFLGVALQSLPDHVHSSSIPVACKCCIRRSITEWCTPICPTTLLLQKHACDMPTACHLSAKAKKKSFKFCEKSFDIPTKNNIAELVKAREMAVVDKTLQFDNHH